MPSVTMLGKLAAVLVAASQANAAIDTFRPSFFESTFVPISAVYPTTTTTDVPKHHPYTAVAANVVEGDAALLAESGGITTVTVYSATCPTMSMSMPMETSTPAWTPTIGLPTTSSLATLFSTKPTTTPSPDSTPGWSAPSSAASSVSSSSTTSTLTPNAPGTPTVWTISSAPAANQTASSTSVAPPVATPTQTHHDSAGSAAAADHYNIALAVVACLVLPFALGF